MKNYLPLPRLKNLDYDFVLLTTQFSKNLPFKCLAQDPNIVNVSRPLDLRPKIVEVNNNLSN